VFISYLDIARAQGWIIGLEHSLGDPQVGWRGLEHHLGDLNVGGRARLQNQSFYHLYSLIHPLSISKRKRVHMQPAFGFNAKEEI
jgi:hypothetical protein